MSNQRQYFGTDGIRGRVGQAPITPDFMLKLGWAVGRVLASHDKVLIGKDTRISGYMFESALEAGLAAAGVDSYLLGPIPTPAVAYLTRLLEAKAGIVISASHNAFPDNGVKFFGSDGMKLDDELELAIEEQLSKEMTCVGAEYLGRAMREEQASEDYLAYCQGCFPEAFSLKGMKIVVDCAHGSTYRIAPRLFEMLGAKIELIGCEPDGFNINQNCGSTNLNFLSAAVKHARADVGIAFDGDGDRVMMVDANGQRVDGDQLLFIISEYFRQQDRLVGGVVGTAMTNFALELAFQQRGVGFARSQVGDRYVLAELLERGWQLGGESSGHIVHLGFSTTGDGIVSALQVLAAMCFTDRSLAELTAELVLFPQQLINVSVKSISDPMTNSVISQSVMAAERQLSGKGRVLLRPSGTEPVIRVMVEGQDGKEVLTLAQHLSELVQTTLT